MPTAEAAPSAVSHVRRRMSADVIGEAKAALRRSMRERRDALTAAERDEASAAAARHAVSLIDRLGMKPAAVVAGYWPMRGEIDPRPALAALAARGRPVALPVVIRKDAPLVFRRWTPGDPLTRDAMGLECPGETMPAHEPEFLLVPLLAFDAKGHRLGYGAGFYDRTIAALRAKRRTAAFGYAYAMQQVSQVPAGAGDVRLDGIVTERDVIFSDAQQGAPGGR